MNFSLGLMLYFALGLAVAQLRRSQGLSPGDALFCGLFWPLDVVRRGIEILVRSLVRPA